LGRNAPPFDAYPYRQDIRSGCNHRPSESVSNDHKEVPESGACENKAIRLLWLEHFLVNILR
jgi:hypothetical protein